MANPLDKLMSKIDKIQQSHPVLAFPYSVIKKYGEDEAGNLGALITYYGFLSLFPLLLVATTATQIFLHGHEHLRGRVTDAVNHYFPVIGDQLQNSVHTSHKTGLALLIGVLFTIYGARGGATAFQNALNHIWQIPKVNRPGFPKQAGKSVVITLGGGLGIVLAAVISGYATALDSVLVLRVVPIAVSLVILTLVFYFIFRFTIAGRGPSKKVALISATSAAIGVQILQTFGTYLITHQLHNFKNLYGTFAVVLGLLFWVYLQVQVVMYAIEIGSVRDLRLWPRSLQPSKNLTEADKKAYSLLAKKEKLQPPERIGVRFKSSN